MIEIEQELESEGDEKKIKEEIGDLFHATLSLCAYLNYDPKTILLNSEQKFRRRFEATLNLIQSHNIDNLQELSFDDMLRFWEKVKEREFLTSSD